MIAYKHKEGEFINRVSAVCMQISTYGAEIGTQTPRIQSH